MRAFYVIHHDGKTTSCSTPEQVMSISDEAKIWFAVSVYKGKVSLFGHSIGAFDDYEYKCVHARIKRHFGRSNYPG